MSNENKLQTTNTPLQTTNTPLTKAMRAKMRKQTPLGSDLVVADISGSMAGLAKDGRRCIDNLRDALEPLVHQVHVLAFDSNIEEVDADLIPEPRGSTNLALALTRAIELQPLHVLIISDGEPDQRLDQLEPIALELTEWCVIDTLYIGPGNVVAAKDLMKKLAEIGGGRYVEWDIAVDNPLLLGGKVADLLALPAPAGAIKL